MLIAEVCEMESNINREATMNPRTGSASSAQYIYGSLWGSLSCLRLQPVRLLGRLWRAQCGVGNYSRFVNYTARVNWFLPAAMVQGVGDCSHGCRNSLGILLVSVGKLASLLC
jgi:hypothetical protein